jgi:hypothetical protein
MTFILLVGLILLSKTYTLFYKWSRERDIRLNIDLTVNPSLLTFWAKQKGVRSLQVSPRLHND